MRSSFPESGTRDLATVEQAHACGKELGAALEAGDVVILDGPLGAGKTTFTQGIAQGMQVKGRITSPTFVIARVHRSRVGRPDLVHVDAYRLLDEEAPIPAIPWASWMPWIWTPSLPMPSSSPNGAAVSSNRSQKVTCLSASTANRRSLLAPMRTCAASAGRGARMISGISLIARYK